MNSHTLPFPLWFLVSIIIPTTASLYKKQIQICRGKTKAWEGKKTLRRNRVFPLCLWDKHSSEKPLSLTSCHLAATYDERALADRVHGLQQSMAAWADIPHWSTRQDKSKLAHGGEWAHAQEFNNNIFLLNFMWWVGRRARFSITVPRVKYIFSIFPVRQNWKSVLDQLCVFWMDPWGWFVVWWLITVI